MMAGGANINENQKLYYKASQKIDLKVNSEIITHNYDNFTQEGVIMCFDPITAITWPDADIVMDEITIPENVQSISLRFLYGTKYTRTINKVKAFSVEQLCNIIYNDVTANPLYGGGELLINESLITDLNIPNTVSKISDYSFSNCKQLTNVIISNNVTDVGKSAFSGCINIVNVSLPNNITEIKSGIFDGCENLSSINIPENITSIGSSAFNNCSKITNINIPNTVTSIGDYAFSGCLKLNNVLLPEELTFLGKYAFRDCHTFTNINIPENIEIMYDGVFENCIGINSINISILKASWIGENVFKGCTNLKDAIVNIDSSGTGRGLRGWFWDCINLININIDYSDNTTWLERNIFHNCESLVEFNIPNNIEVIGQNAFRGCSSLIKVTIPSTVNKIESGAFLEINPNADIYVPTLTQWFNIDSDYYLDNSANLYINNELLTVVDTTLLSTSSVEIKQNMFKYNKNITKVILGSNVTNVGEAAFSECENLTDIDFKGSSGKVIHNKAFEGCDIKNLDIENISAWCKSSLPTTYHSIQNASTKITSKGNPITEISIPTGSLSTIPSAAFKYFRDLESVTIPDNISAISPYSFQYCSALKTVNGGKNIQSFNEHCFDGCSSLESITIYQNNVRLLTNCFSDCASLNSITCLGNKPTATYNPFNGVAENGVLYYPKGQLYDSWLEETGYLGKLGWTGVEIEVE